MGELYLFLRPDNFDDGDAGLDDDEEEATEENGEKKSQPKKPSKPVSTKSKLEMATVGDKNNASLLSFFQKTSSQKRTASVANGPVEIVSNFLINKKLKTVKTF